MSFQPQNNEQALLYKMLKNGGSSVAISNMSYLFYKGVRLADAQKLYSLCADVTESEYCFAETDITEFNSKSFPDMSKSGSAENMFYDCKNLVRADMSNFRCDSMSSLNGMGFYGAFWGCSSLEEVVGFLYKSSDFPNVRRTFDDCPKLKRLVFASDCGAFQNTNIDISDCAFERSGMVELINSLPVSTGTSILTIAGNPCVTGVAYANMPGGEYGEWIYDVDSLVSIADENILSDEAYCEVEDNEGSSYRFPKVQLADRASKFVFPVMLSWEDYSTESSCEKLTNADRTIAINKGWVLEEG